MNHLVNDPVRTHSGGMDHTFRCRVSWSGSTADGYRAYDRTHVTDLGEAGRLTVSADKAFRGDRSLPNPEVMLVSAAASCQLLSFLAEAAWAGIDVLEYADDATALMPVTRDAMRITRIDLRPRIVVGPGADVQRVHELVETAHDTCFIANTLNCPVVVEATVEVAAP
jgi:organic hydroperoxide reductase OsmC/OhrA